MLNDVSACGKCGSKDIGMKWDGTGRMECQRCGNLGTGEKPFVKNGSHDRAVKRWNDENSHVMGIDWAEGKDKNGVMMVVYESKD